MSRLTRLVGRVGRKLKAMVPDAPAPVGIPLTVVEEARVLPRVADALAAPLDGPGVIASVVVQTILGQVEARAVSAGKSGGVDVPAWAHGDNGALRAAVDLVRVKDAWYAPAFGAVFDGEGRVFKRAVHEALYLTPTLAALPHTRREGEVTLFEPPADPPVIPRATVFLAWGGLHNYGHFLIDCLPALLAAKQAGALDSHPAVAPPLLPWQVELLNLLDVPPPVVIEAPVARLGEAIYATAMDHFLHEPGPPLDAVRDRILASAVITDDPAASSKIYVSRLGSLKRVLVNEAELEAALEARGFTIVRPEVLSVRDQIALFHRAEVVVASAGAALANILFCKPGAKVIEIQPSNFIGVWVRNIALLIGIDWRGFFAPSPLSETEVVMEGELRPASEFRWKLDLPGFLTFLDGAL